MPFAQVVALRQGVGLQTNRLYLAVGFLAIAEDERGLVDLVR